MTVPRLSLSLLAVAALAVNVAAVHAQGAFPAPLPGQAVKSSPFPPVNGVPAQAPAQTAAPSAFTTGAPPIGGGGFSGPPIQQQQAGPSDECTNGFLSLRKDAENRANMVRAAGQRHASPQEACKLIGNFSQAELKMIKYVETNAKKCGIPPQLAEQMKKGHANTEQTLAKICAAGAQAQQGPAGPSLSEVLGSPTLPEAKPTKRSGGSTFDTLNGNVLAR